MIEETEPAPSRPMLGGLGRNSRLEAAIAALSPDYRNELLAALDEVTRPMSPRELEDALLQTGLPRSDRRKLVLALKPLAILMLVTA